MLPEFDLLVVDWEPTVRTVDLDPYAVPETPTPVLRVLVPGLSHHDAETMAHDINRDFMDCYPAEWLEWAVAVPSSLGVRSGDVIKPVTVQRAV